jgi:hypothetical protein
MEDNKNGPGWDRHEMTLRLTKQRRELLRALASTLPGAPTLTEIIDLALARSARLGDASEDRLRDLEEAIEGFAIERRFEADCFEKSLRLVAEQVESLRKLIEQAAAEPYDG